MEIKLRLEQKGDYEVVEKLTRKAFWNHYSPGCNEHYVVHILRGSQAFVNELDFVAVLDNIIVGNIMYSKAIILGNNGTEHPVLTFGPISVLPEYQSQGVGTKLIEHTKSIAKELGYKAILIYGDPDYYKRVGFVPAEDYDIGTSGNTYAGSLLACELAPKALESCSGRFFEDDIYNIDINSAEEFDKKFPPCEKISGTPSQERFAYLVSLNKPR